MPVRILPACPIARATGWRPWLGFCAADGIRQPDRFPVSYFFRDDERRVVPLLRLVRDDRFLRPGLAFLPPPVSLLTVAQARRFASPLLVPRRWYPSSMCRAWRFCFEL